MKIKQAPLGKFVKINPEGITQGYPYQVIEYIDISSVGSGQLVEQPEEILLKDAPSRAKRIVRNKDIILATVRPNLRSFLFIKNPNDNTVVSTGFAVLRTKESADPRFIYYAITDSKFTGYLTNNTKGTSYPAVDSGIVLRGDIPDFDFKKQQYIGELLSAYDDLIDTNRRRIQLLEEAARLLFREWFVYFRFPGHEKVKIVHGVPEGWERQPIASISDCVGGGTPSTSMPAYWVDGHISWVTPTDVTRNKHFVLLDSEKKITEAGLQNSSAKIVPAHTVLMTSRASVGFFAIANREVCTNQGFISIVPHDAVFSLFLLFQLSERVEEIRAMGSGSTYPEVSRGKFRDFKVTIPPKKMVSDFDEQVSLFFKQITNLKQQNQKLAQARDLLLPRLMSGAIEV